MNYVLVVAPWIVHCKFWLNLVNVSLRELSAISHCLHVLDNDPNLDLTKRSRIFSKFSTCILSLGFSIALSSAESTCSVGSTTAPVENGVPNDP